MNSFLGSASFELIRGAETEPYTVLPSAGQVLSCYERRSVPGLPGTEACLQQAYSSQPFPVENPRVEIKALEQVLQGHSSQRDGWVTGKALVLRS